MGANKRLGFGLVAVVISLAVVSIASLFLGRMSTVGFRVQRALELRSTKSSLRTTLLQRLHCPNTLATGTPAVTLANAGTACTSTNFLRFKDAMNNDIGIWDSPTSSVRFGDYSYQTTCQSGPPGSLVIRGARPGAGSPSCVGFQLDPMTKICLDWNNPNNYVMDVPNGETICGGYLDPSSGPKYIEVTNSGLTLAPPNCEINGGNTHPWGTVTVYCPTGYRRVSGGGQCAWGFFGTSTAVTGPGGEDGWFLGCCTFPSHTANATTYSNAWIKCIRDADYQ